MNRRALPHPGNDSAAWIRGDAEALVFTREARKALPRDIEQVAQAQPRVPNVRDQLLEFLRVVVHGRL